MLLTSIIHKSEISQPFFNSFPTRCHDKSMSKRHTNLFPIKHMLLSLLLGFMLVSQAYSLNNAIVETSSPMSNSSLIHEMAPSDTENHNNTDHSCCEIEQDLCECDPGTGCSITAAVSNPSSAPISANHIAFNKAGPHPNSLPNNLFRPPIA